MNFINMVVSKEYLNNTLYSYLVSLAVFILLSIIVFLLRYIVICKLKKRAEAKIIKLDVIIINLIKRNIIPTLYFGVFYFSISLLNIPKMADKAIKIIGIILLSFFIIKIISVLFQKAVEAHFEKNQHDEDYVKTAKVIFPAVNIVVWVIGIIFLLGNLGFNVTSIVTGLGIGGIAVALAAQAVLGDLFSYFAILIDKPFEIGDFVIVNNEKGTIEKVGIKTTKVRSLSGEQLVFSNSTLTNSTIKNYKRMFERRIVFQFGVVYSTNVEKLKSISKKVKEIIESIEQTRFDRSHFFDFGDFSLNFETVYFVLSNDYIIYMNIQEEINLRLKQFFLENDIAFAYPTSVVYLEK